MTTKYDFVIVADATGSMGSYMEAIKSALPQIFEILPLTNAKENTNNKKINFYDRQFRPFQ